MIANLTKTEVTFLSIHVAVSYALGLSVILIYLYLREILCLPA